MRRLKNALIVSVLTCGLVVTPVFATPSVDDLKKEKEAAESQVSSLQSELTAIISKISSLEVELTETGEEIIQAEKDLNLAKEKETEQYEAMKLRIRFMYERGDSSFMETLVEADDFSDLVNKAEYVQNVHTYDRNQLQEYVVTKQKVETLSQTLKTEMAKLEEKQTEFHANKDTLNATLESKQSEVANLDGEIQAAALKAEQERKLKEEEEAKLQRAAANNTPAQGSGSAGGTGGGAANNGGGSQPSYGGQGNTAAAQAIVSAAYSQIGVPYVWGGNSPGSGLDCSGLTQYAHRTAGISIPRNSEAQLAAGQRVSDPQPGDICWTPGHVAIYIGGGKMIEAQQTGTNIMISNVRASAYVRFW